MDEIHSLTKNKDLIRRSAGGGGTPGGGEGASGDELSESIVEASVENK